MTESTKNKPVEIIRDGTLKVAIWKNKTDNGFRFSTGSVVRSYQDQNNNWQEVEYLSNGEILRGSNLLTRAYNRILILKSESKSTG